MGDIKAHNVVYATHIPPAINILHFRCAPYKSYAIAFALNERTTLLRSVMTWKIYTPGVIGLGLGEDTGIVIHKGDMMEVVGSGLVVIIDGSTINYTDLTEISDSKPITVEGITMHMLGPGKKFSLGEKQLIQE